MKKFILSAVAAGALAFGGAASAQDLGGVLTNILGNLGFPAQNYGYGYGNGTVLPGVVAQPYGNGNGSVYVDQYGRQVTVDQYGRQVLVQPNTNVYGTNNYGGVVYDQYGRPLVRDAYGNYVYGTGNVYGGGNYAYSNRAWDRDGDGIANTRDRWPDDRRYY